MRHSFSTWNCSTSGNSRFVDPRFNQDSEVRVFGRENLTASDVGCQGTSRKNLVVRDGHDVLRENYKISKLACLDRPFHLLLERSVRTVHGEQTQGFGPADLLLGTKQHPVPRFARHIIVKKSERVVGMGIVRSGPPEIATGA